MFYGSIVMFYRSIVIWKYSNVLWKYSKIYWDLEIAVCFVAPGPPLLNNAVEQRRCWTTAVSGPQNTLFSSVSVNKW
jgi:hypothetical protein